MWYEGLFITFHYFEISLLKSWWWWSDFYLFIFSKFILPSNEFWITKNSHLTTKKTPVLIYPVSTLKSNLQNKYSSNWPTPNHKPYPKIDLTQIELALQFISYQKPLAVYILWWSLQLEGSSPPSGGCDVVTLRKLIPGPAKWVSFSTFSLKVVPELSIENASHLNMNFLYALL